MVLCDGFVIGQVLHGVSLLAHDRSEWRDTSWFKERYRGVMDAYDDVVGSGPDGDIPTCVAKRSA